MMHPRTTGASRQARLAVRLAARRYNRSYPCRLPTTIPWCANKKEQETLVTMPPPRYWSGLNPSSMLHHALRSGVFIQTSIPMKCRPSQRPLLSSQQRDIPSTEDYRKTPLNVLPIRRLLLLHTTTATDRATAASVSPLGRRNTIRRLRSSEAYCGRYPKRWQCGADPTDGQIDCQNQYPLKRQSGTARAESVYSETTLSDSGPRALARTKVETGTS